ncbi:MAG TPA: hypothetical protein VD948_06135, partial [Rhodothermales bacterium]|nr:hypothetical protein [Rhodothermales bacterium]
AAAALLTLSLVACDTGGSSSEKAVYYVAGVRYTLNASGTRLTASSRVAIEYAGPNGIQRDTISGALVTWSKMFDRDELPELRLKATNLSARDTMKQPNFVSVTLRVAGEVVAQDTSATTAEVRQ